jgi:thiol-disulfide isomerase/thioredoxin
LRGKDLDGQALSTSDFAGRVTVVNLWGHWCAPCRAEAPVLKEVADEYASRNVQFVGIVNRSDPQAALAFNSSFGITYPSFADQGGALELSFRKSLPTTAIPTTWVLDTRARVAARIIDPDLAKSTLVGVLDDVLDDSTE